MKTRQLLISLLAFMFLLASVFIPITGASHSTKHIGMLNTIVDNFEIMNLTKEGIPMFKQSVADSHPWLNMENNNLILENEDAVIEDIKMSRRFRRALQQDQPNPEIIPQENTNQCDKMTKDELLEITGEENKTVVQLIEKIGNEFNRYPGLANYKYNWFTRLFISNEDLLSDGIETVCTGLYFDIEDEYNGLSLNAEQETGRTRRRNYVYFQDDEKHKILTKSVEEKLRYFLRKLMWCDDKNPENTYLRHDNALGLRKLLIIYRSSEMKQMLGKGEIRMVTDIVEKRNRDKTTTQTSGPLIRVAP